MPQALLVEDSAVQRRAISGLLESIQINTVQANNGRDALERLKSLTPDVIISDMVMPDMDGIELVREIRARSPHLPVLLITAHGNESLVVEALRSGASSYVPKDKLLELLPATVANILSIARCERTYEELIGSATKAELEFRLDNDPELVEPLVDLLQQLISSICQIEANDRVRVAVAIQQALNNALFRGNLEVPGPAALAVGIANIDPEIRRHRPPYASRHIDVVAEVTPHYSRVVVRDDGPGFDVVAAQLAEQQAGFTENRGRGLVLMQAFMDEVRFNERGNEVTLIKNARRSSESTQTEAPSTSTDKRRPKPLATLTPIEPGESFELRRSRVIIGRDRSCDVVLPFQDVSSHHCQLFLFSGWWFVKDLHTKNGIRVNGAPVTRRRLVPGDVLAVATHKFEIQYDPGELGAVGVTPPPVPF